MRDTVDEIEIAGRYDLAVRLLCDRRHVSESGGRYIERRVDDAVSIEPNEVAALGTVDLAEISRKDDLAVGLPRNMVAGVITDNVLEGLIDGAVRVEPHQSIFRSAVVETSCD